MEQAKLDRINELTRISRERELSETETAEREILRKEYIAEWKQSTEAALKNVVVIEPDGSKHKIKEKE